MAGREPDQLHDSNLIGVRHDQLDFFTLEIDMTTNADADNVQALIPIVKQ